MAKRKSKIMSIEKIEQELGINNDWNPRLSDEQLDTKYGAYKVTPTIIDQRHIMQNELAYEGQTYIALYPDKQTAKNVYDWCLDIGIPNPVKSNILHITMFSINRASEKNWKDGPIKPITVMPEHIGTAIILQSSRNLFVLNMLNSSLSQRRESMSKMLKGRMENPGYFHMTVSYNVGSWRDRQHHKINFPLTFLREESRQPRF
jgi:hypothetical protein